MNKNHISFKAFFLALLLGFTDPTMVMGADDAAPSTMINTSPQSERVLPQRMRDLLNDKGNLVLSEDVFNQKINDIFNKENDLSLTFSMFSEEGSGLTGEHLSRIFDAIKTSNNLAAILTKDIADKVSLQILKGNLIPTFLDLDNKKYKNIGLSGSFRGSTTLILRDLPALEGLVIHSNNVLANLAVEGLPLLKMVWVNKNPALITLTLQDLPALQGLVITSNNVLANLAVEGLHLLRAIKVESNDALSILTLQDLPVLQGLIIHSNNILTNLTLEDLLILSSLELHNNNKLRKVKASRNQDRQTFEYNHIIDMHDDEDDVNQILDFLNPNVAQAQAIIGQEAIVRGQKLFIAVYKSFVESANNKLFLNFIPQEGEVQQCFTRDTGAMFVFLKEYQDSLGLRSDLDSVTKRFRAEQALIGVQLLQGKNKDYQDVDIPNHEISLHASYPVYKLRNDLPNIKQLFCFVYGAAQAKYDEIWSKNVGYFAQVWIAENFGDIRNFSECANFNDTGPFLLSDKGSELIEKITKSIKSGGNTFIFGINESNINKKIMQNFKISYKLLESFQQSPLFESLKETKQDALNPLIEALFMTMRGHNINFDEQDEPNKPACAQGAYLQLLQALGEVVNNRNMQNAIAGIEIVSCAAPA